MGAGNTSFDSQSAERWLLTADTQIDNQLYGTMFPILLYPTNVTKEGGNQEIVPTFQLGLDRVKDDCE